MSFRYRIATTKDADNIRTYCKEHNAECPLDSLHDQIQIVLAEDEQGVLMGLSALKRMFVIEPLLGGSVRNQIVLAEKLMSVAGHAGGNEVVAMVKGDNHTFISNLESYGFVITDKNMTILRKGL